MKRILIFAAAMFIIVVFLPFLIVGGCKHNAEKEKPPEVVQTPDEITIKVYIKTTGKAEEMPLEKYVKEVMAAEMPAEFEPEALKAQAVAARTYAYGRLRKYYVSNDAVHEGADICTDFSCCQAWISKDEAMKKWNVFKAAGYWAKIEQAVENTKGIILLYNEKVVNPVFHSNSGGKTENSEDVWAGVSVPYLKSVESAGEDACPEYKASTLIKCCDFYAKLKESFPNIKVNQDKIQDAIKISGYTAGGRVAMVQIGNIQIKGTEFRKLFTLRSANFIIEKSGKDALKITTTGNGHGVGMSQWGANYLAKTGYTFEQILAYYYQGVEVMAISDYEGR